MVQEKEPFELIEHLGTGGFAQTWLARVIDTDLIEEWEVEKVAIKIPLSKQKSRDLKKGDIGLSIMLHNQLTEIESLNIVKYLGFEIFKGKLVMVMKYMPDGSLRDMIGKIGHWKRMEIKMAMTIAGGILKGLSVIHKGHIVHRDIKPENILMDGKIPKISDFGIGRMLKPDELAGTARGSPYYMSPELLYDEVGASFNTDIWSFGITFYEMLCGQFSFGITDKTPNGTIYELIKDETILFN